MSFKYNGYLAAVALPIDPPPEAIATDCHVSRWYLVGEYFDYETALSECKHTAINYHADAYHVFSPKDKDYAKIRSKLTAEYSGLSNYQEVTYA